MDISANWIWSDASDGRGYNLCSVFRKEFRLEELPAAAQIAVSADSSYRLKINGQWIGDGPARSYPEHFRYDLTDLEGMLRRGVNQIEITVRYYGCGSFHLMPQRAAVLAQLELTGADGERTLIITDSSWLAAPLPQWRERVAKISVQQCPGEYFDASVTTPMAWVPATVVATAEGGPWRNLAPRDCAPLSRREALLARFEGIRRVDRELFVLAVSPRRIAFPGDTTVNLADTCPLLFAWEILSPEAQEIEIPAVNLKLTVNGRPPEGGRFPFRKGTNLVVGTMTNLEGHGCLCEIAFRPESGIGAEQIQSALVVEFPALNVLCPDLPFNWANAPLAERKRAYGEAVAPALRLRDCAAFRQAFPSARPLRPGEFVDDTAHQSFLHRRPRPAEPGDVEAPENLIYSDDRCAIIHPVPNADLELCFDLGEQNIGYWNFSLFAAAGTIVDIAAVEYVSPDGILQHTGPESRNSMRYICREGCNRYTSFKRRSGRYLLVTLRNQSAPVRFQFLRLVESTYPVIPEGGFHCSDPRLDRIYRISQHTLKLCMEDTFTDCPLYEQTLWVGDARSESLFAMSCFGAYDLVRRCIRLAGQSLDQLPLVACQVPSGWQSIIPIWSFMWGISVYDYYFETGDLAFCREIWPMVRKNLEGANERIDPTTGLFRSFDWNLFDWSHTDCSHEIMIQNSLFLVGALDAAWKLATLLDEPETAGLYATRRSALTDALARAWDSRKLAWPDSIRENGVHSDDISIHTSMLAALYDAAPEELQPAIRANTVSPRPELIPISSPFAAFYLYEALEKLGQPGEILEAIYRDYLPMLRRGATTVWETIPADKVSSAAYLPRSHCHGWSAAPLYFLPRLVLGLTPLEPGGRKFAVSPRVAGLDFAAGSRPTVAGRIDLEWTKEGELLHIRATVPAGVELEFRPNDTTTEFEVVLSTRTR